MPGLLPNPRALDGRSAIASASPLHVPGALSAPLPGARRRLAAFLTASLALATVLGGLPGPAAAATIPPPTAIAAPTATATAMAASVLGRLNRDRAARGLFPLRTWSVLASLANERAASMAMTGTMSHDAAGGNVTSVLSARGIQSYGSGEIIGASTYPWGSRAASNVYTLWKGSPTHRAIMFSSRYNYVGVAFVYRAATKTTYASLVFSESKDHTGAAARNLSLRRRGTTITFAWTGHDPRLQTHTAGLRSFDVQYRVDGGGWRTIRNDTTHRSLTMHGRPHGHWYSFRVQAADRRGNLSRWTGAKRIWVP